MPMVDDWRGGRPLGRRPIRNQAHHREHSCTFAAQRRGRGAIAIREKRRNGAAPQDFCDFSDVKPARAATR